MLLTPPMRQHRLRYNHGRRTNPHSGSRNHARARLAEGVKFALKAAWDKRNGRNNRGNPGNPNSICKYDRANAAIMNERLAELIKCVEKVEDLLREGR
jgi:hypothetical protein